MTRYLLDTQHLSDRDGPWYEQAFLEPATRQRAASRGKTLPDLIQVEKRRHKSGWVVTVYEIQESDG